MTGREKEPERGLTDAESAELTRDILARTSGSACDHAHDLLPAHVYDGLAGTDDELLRSHLAHCDGCAELARAMTWTKALLPAMAAMEPDAHFTADVLAATTRASRPAAAAPWPERLRAYGRRLWLRPRFALEVAYVATMAMLFLLGAPFSTGTHAPGRALDVATGTLAPNLADLQATANRGVRLWSTSREHAGEAVQDFGADLGARGRRAGAAAGDLRTDAGLLIGAAGSLELELAVGHLEAMGGDVAGVWHALFGPAPAADPTE